MFYSVVTFGNAPSRKVFTSVDRAKAAAARAVGVGSCSTARVYECESRDMAKTADISRVRRGERIVS
jgi:predicted metal-binding protein